ncbi:MAG TPA: alanine racemase [Gemmatimonadaceae bacterium]|nr:alanine racemase [Gemmatimonadaceae bacterium]
MLSAAWLEVDLAALTRNARALRDHAAVSIIPMIKADAYGLGAIHVARALERLEPLAYGVATIEEGEELRAAGIARDILLFTPLLQEDLKSAAAAGLTPTLGSADEIAGWKNYHRPYHLSIDTGMARAGIPWREVQNASVVIEQNPPAGAFTHFHSPQLDDASMAEQLGRFREAVAILGRRNTILHTDSSAAIVRHGRSPFDAIRPGIFMYGVGSGATAALEPECVVWLRARIVALRWIETGDTVSYDATYRATSRRLIATVPLGYADGYPRGASNAGVAVLRHHIVPIAGRVTMDMIMLDVTDTGAEIGDIVTLIGDGSADGAPIDAASVAQVAGMSPYELLTGFRSRIHRVYRGLEQ